MKGVRYFVPYLFALLVGNTVLALRIIPEPAPAVIDHDTEAPWRLPVQAETPSLEDAYARMRSRLAWGLEQPSSPVRSKRQDDSPVAVAPKTGWRFAGVVYEGDTVYALVEKDNNMKHYAVGADLLENSQIVAIGIDTLEVETDNGRETYRLYAVQ